MTVETKGLTAAHAENGGAQIEIIGNVTASSKVSEVQHELNISNTDLEANERKFSLDGLTYYPELNWFTRNAALNPPKRFGFERSHRPLETTSVNKAVPKIFTEAMCQPYADI